MAVVSPAHARVPKHTRLKRGRSAYKLLRDLQRLCRDIIHEQNGMWSKADARAVLRSIERGRANSEQDVTSA